MSNDLISREALKTAFAEYGEKAKFTQGACQQLIDNAPTVEYTFEEAFQKTVCEQRLYCTERPQGEWTNTSPYDDKGECPFCCYLSKKYYKFCPNCGKRLRGKEE